MKVNLICRDPKDPIDVCEPQKAIKQSSGPQMGARISGDLEVEYSLS